jgi:hypothetical protein
MGAPVNSRCKEERESGGRSHPNAQEPVHISCPPAPRMMFTDMRHRTSLRLLSHRRCHKFFNVEEKRLALLSTSSITAGSLKVRGWQNNRWVRDRFLVLQASPHDRLADEFYCLRCLKDIAAPPSRGVISRIRVCSGTERTTGGVVVLAVDPHLYTRDRGSQVIGSGGPGAFGSQQVGVG